MYIHIGNKKRVSINSIIGIFNIETIKMSQENKALLKSISSDCKTIAVCINKKIICSTVSPYTVIKRGNDFNDTVWKR